MPIRLSGMVSGMDTDSLVEALVSSYKMKKDNLVKAQTKLSWKQDKWKSMNSNIYKFYSGKLSAARLSSSYSIKTASVSNSSVAKVTAASGAVNGSQTLEVEELASTGYLTGGVIENSDGSKLTLSSKISEVKGLQGFSSGSFTVTTKDGANEINVTSDTTINQFVAKLKEAGLNANFDTSNARFFISASESGADNDYTLTASNASGIDLMQNLGIYATTLKSAKEYEAWANYTDEELEEMAQKTAKNQVKSVDDRAKKYAEEYNAAYNAAKVIKDKNGSLSEMESKKAEYETKMAEYDEYKSVDEEGNVTYDTEAIDAAGKSADFKKDKANLDNISKAIENYNKYQDTMSEKEDYIVKLDSGKASVATEGSPAYTRIQAEYDADYEAKYQENLDSYKQKRTYAADLVANGGEAAATGASAKAVRIEGKDSKIILNGATFTSSSNTFAINGLTIQATAKTNGEVVNITTDTDVDGIYNFVKDFIKEYNMLIKEMDVNYNAASAKGFEPLTDDEKSAMSDDEVEKWEEKIKTSLLRKDGTLGMTMNSLKADMAAAIKVDGKSYSLASFGIQTLGYFASPENETGVYHIDGDSEDTATAGTSDKLRKAIASDADTVISFFSQLATKVYTDLGDRMATSATSSAYTIYNDKEMNTQYSEYKTKITDAEDKVTTWEDYYYKKFSAMESALSNINSQQSSLSGYFGKG